MDPSKDDGFTEICANTICFGLFFLNNGSVLVIPGALTVPKRAQIPTMRLSAPNSGERIKVQLLRETSRFENEAVNILISEASAELEPSEAQPRHRRPRAPFQA